MPLTIDKNCSIYLIDKPESDPSNNPTQAKTLQKLKTGTTEEARKELENLTGDEIMGMLVINRETERCWVIEGSYLPALLDVDQMSGDVGSHSSKRMRDASFRTASMDPTDELFDSYFTFEIEMEKKSHDLVNNTIAMEAQRHYKTTVDAMTQTQLTWVKTAEQTAQLASRELETTIQMLEEKYEVALNSDSVWVLAQQLEKKSVRWFKTAVAFRELAEKFQQIEGDREAKQHRDWHPGALQQKLDDGSAHHLFYGISEVAVAWASVSLKCVVGLDQIVSELFGLFHDSSPPNTDKAFSLVDNLHQLSHKWQLTSLSLSNLANTTHYTSEVENQYGQWYHMASSVINSWSNMSHNCAMLASSLVDPTLTSQCKPLGESQRHLTDNGNQSEEAPQIATEIMGSNPFEKPLEQPPSDETPAQELNTVTADTTN